MSQMSWSQAIGAILTYYKIETQDVVIPSPQTLKSLRHILKGTDLTARTLKNVDVILGADVDSALLLRRDGGYLPLVYDKGLPMIVDAKGCLQTIATQEDMDAIKTGWVFLKKESLGESIFSFYRQHKKPVLQIMVCGLFVNLFALCLPVFSSFVYDKVLGNQIHETLWALVIGLLFIAGIDFSLRALRLLLAERFALVNDADIDHHVFQGILGSDTQTLPSMGRFLDRYKRLLAHRELLSSTYLLSLVDLPFLILFLALIAAVAGSLVFIPLAFGGGMLFINYLTSLPSQDYDLKSRHSDEQRFRLITDVIASHEAVVGSHWGTALANRWRIACDKTSSCLSLSRYWRNLGVAFSHSASFLSYIFVITGGAYMVDERTLTSGGLLAVSMLSSRVIASFSSVITLATRYKDFKSALKEMNTILHEPASKNEVLPSTIKGDILFNKISCTLGQNKNPILSNINLKINHGEFIGIAGTPGSGKTTLLRLIHGLIRPQNGEILIDHYPVSSFSPSALAKTMGYKPQDLCLLEGSIENNIAAGKPQPLSQEQRDHVLSASGLGW